MDNKEINVIIKKLIDNDKMINLWNQKHQKFFRVFEILFYSFVT